MSTPRTRPSPSARDREVPAKQIHRWLDDGGAHVSEPTDDPAPVTWSPVALNARLAAERALHMLRRRPRGASADARVTISHVVRQVERRQLDQRTAAIRLREITVRLEQHLITDREQQAPNSWQLLRAHTPALERPTHRVLAAGFDDDRGGASLAA